MILRSYLTKMHTKKTLKTSTTFSNRNSHWKTKTLAPLSQSYLLPTNATGSKLGAQPILPICSFKNMTSITISANDDIPTTNQNPSTNHPINCWI
jgi:hypothetical protein